MSHAARIERLNERLPERESGGILNWMGRHPVLSGLGLTALTMGGLALGTHSGLFQTAWLAKNAPWLNTAGQWVSTNAMKFWSWVLLALGVKSAAAAADNPTVVPGPPPAGQGARLDYYGR